MTSEPEAYGVAQGAGRQLATFSSPFVGGPAGIAANLASIVGPFFDLIGNNAFSRAYRQQKLGGLQEQEAGVRMQEAKMRMQIEQMELTHARMMDNMEEASVKHQEMLTDYGEVFKRIKSPQNPNGDLTEDQARQQIANLNIKWHHQNMDNMLQNRDLRGVQEFLAWEHGKFLDWLSAHTTFEKSKGPSGKTRAEESELDKAIVAGSPGGAGAGDSGVSKALGVPPVGGTQPAAATDETTAQQQIENPDAGNMDEALKQKWGIGNTGVSLAHSVLAGDKNDKELRLEAKENSGKVISATEDMRSAINKAAAAGGTSPQDTQHRFDAVRAIDSRVADIAKGLSRYEIDPKSKEGQRWSGLAHQIDPTYDQNNYNAAHKFSDPTTSEYRVIERADTFMQDLIQANDALNKVPGAEDAAIWQNKWNAWQAGTLTGDPEWSNLFNQLQAVATHYNGIQTLTGSVKVSLIGKSMEHLPPTASARAIREQLLGDAVDTWAVIGSNQQAWQRLGKQDLVPGLTPDVWRSFSAYLRSNPDTGEMPKGKDVPDEIRAISHDDISGASSRLSDAQKWHPASLQQIRDMRAFNAKYRDSPREDIQAAIRRNIQILGTVLYRPLEVPGEPVDAGQ